MPLLHPVLSSTMNTMYIYKVYHLQYCDMTALLCLQVVMRGWLPSAQIYTMWTRSMTPSGACLDIS